MEPLITMTTGAGAFRFVLQPLMSVVRGYRDGQQDWRHQQAPYGKRLLCRTLCADGLRSGLRTIWPVMLLAIVLDLYYQQQLFGDISLSLTLAVTVLLALLPYSLSRMLSHHWLNRRQSQTLP